MKKTISLIALSAVALTSCGDKGHKKGHDHSGEHKHEHGHGHDGHNHHDHDAMAPNFINEAHEMVYNMTQKVGTYKQLLALKDVSYNYSYKTADGKEDVTLEQYIFAGEKSYGKYLKHERTLPELKGTIEQGFDGTNFWFRNDGKYSSDEAILKRVTFNRKTNFYWFTMMQKLTDPGLTYEHLGEKTVDGQKYDVVKVGFGDQGKPTDIYQLYINQETKLADQFLFTVADFGKVETPFLMKVKYETIDGIMIPSTRQYAPSSWDGVVEGDQWVQVRWTDIKFNTGLKKELFVQK